MKTTPIDRVVEGIADNDIVFFGYGHVGLEPLMEALCSRIGERRLDIVIPFLRFRREDYLDLERFTSAPGVRLVTPLPVPEQSKMIAAGRLHVLPVTYSELVRYLQVEAGRRRLWVFVEVSRPERGHSNSGYISISPRGLLRKSRTIGILNDELPLTYGDSVIPTSLIHAFTELPGARLPLLAPHQEGEASRRIGSYVSELIEDGSTLQLGVGSALASVCAHLKGKERLRVHTGLFHDGFQDLVDRGVVTGECRAHVAVPTSLDRYRWMTENRALQIRNFDYIYGSDVMSNITDFAAVNSAIYVDLNGQAVATALNSRTVSGIGGLLDFARGAKLSKGGKSIIAVESTHKNGEESSIKGAVPPGDPIALTCYDVDYVVTEHGIAELAGKSRAERARELTEVADPNHRDELRRSDS